MGPRAARAMVALAVGVLVGAAGPRSPQVNYMLNCQGCHLPDGRGVAGRVPDMRGQLGELLRVPGGRAFIVQVPGTANAKLTDAEIADLLNWLVPRMRSDPSVNFTPYSPAEVRELRAVRLRDVADVRAALAGDIRRRADRRAHTLEKKN